MIKAAYKHVIFDLDGTISDSRQGIYSAYSYTADRLGIQLPEGEEMESLIGPPLQQGFREVFGLSGSDIDRAVTVFREYYGQKGLYENILYEGIEALLEELKRANAKLYVATAKYQLFAERVLNYFKISSYFQEVAGADYDGIHAGKTNLVAGILMRNGITDPSSAVVVGDTRFDITAAAELEIDSVGVSYGFSSMEQIERMNPDYIAVDVAALKQILLVEVA